MKLLKILPLVASLSVILSLTGCEKSVQEEQEDTEQLTPAQPIEKDETKTEINETPTLVSTGWDKVEGWDVVRAYIQKDALKNEPLPMNKSSSGALISKATETFTPCFTNLSDKTLMAATSVQGFNNNLRVAEKNTLLHVLLPKSTRCFSPYNLNLKAPLAMGWMVYAAELKEDSEISADSKPVAYGVLHLGETVSTEELVLWGKDYPQYDPNNIEDKRKEQEAKNKIELEAKARQETTSLKEAVEKTTTEEKK